MTAAAQAPESRRDDRRGVWLAAPEFFPSKQVVRSASGVVWRAGGVIQLAMHSSRFLSWAGTARHEATPRFAGFWDLGRLHRIDSRFSTVDFKTLLRWANWGAVAGTAIRYSCRRSATSVANRRFPKRTNRFVALGAWPPEHCQDHAVTVTGRFPAITKSVLGDLPQPVNKWPHGTSVNQSADGAVWVSGGVREARDSTSTRWRVRTGQWLQVSGTLRTTARLTWIEAPLARDRRRPNANRL
jgi:hypothetical protein